MKKGPVPCYFSETFLSFEIQRKIKLICDHVWCPDFKNCINNLENTHFSELS